MAQHIATIQEIRDRTVAQEQQISDDDLLPFDHGTGSNRHRAFTVGEIIAYLKANKLDGMTIGTTAEIKTSSGNPVIVNFYAIDAGSIEAKMEFVVGNSKWEANNGQPIIRGLYGVAANSLDAATEVKTDSIDSHTAANANIDVKKRLVGDSSDLTKPIKLGKTEVDGDLNVTNDASIAGDTSVTGKFSAGKIIAGNQVIEITDATSVANAEIAMSAMDDGRLVFVVNTTSSALEVHFSGGAVLNIAAKSGVSVIKYNGDCYPLNV